MINKNKSTNFGYKEIIDDVIFEYYHELLKNIGKHFKTGDFIKMLELRRKLSPTDVEQKKFWQMINKIRHETLGQPKAKKAKAVKSKKRK